MTQETANRVEPLLALRGVAALLVVLCHVNPNFEFRPAGYLVWYNLDLTPIRNLLWLLKPNGAVCVWIFFCLSGYLMGKAFFTGRYKLSVDGIKSFYFNRITRIAPLTYV